mmetsp:Transcript_770/g.1194  ORF Transcript_770/g.1194 Transcript_770/m.1194 type:complete len:92 (-) Transcript_770:43-318(-)
MTRSTFMFLALFLVAVGALESSPATATPQGKPIPSYLDGAVFQDLRLLVSFGLGIACVHTAELLLGDGGSGNQADANSFQRKHFELYPFAL